jgi:hypothetical protein
LFSSLGRIVFRLLSVALARTDFLSLPQRLALYFGADSRL